MSIGGDNGNLITSEEIHIPSTSISIPIFRSSKSHRYEFYIKLVIKPFFDARCCVICGNIDPQSLKVLTQEQRTMIFLKRGVLVAPGSRCCSDHLYKNQLTIESFDHIQVSKADRWEIDATGFQIFVEDVRSILFNQKCFDFDDRTCLKDEGYRNIVGVTKGISELKL